MERQIHVPDCLDTVDGKEIFIAEAYHKLANSQLGQGLANQVRYARYKPEGISNEEWCSSSLLGDDVNNMRHMWDTTKLAKEYLLGQSPETALNHSDSQVLMMSAVVHDFVESVVGDITFDKKSRIDKKHEAQGMSFMLRAMFGNTLPNKKIRQIYRTVMDGSSKLGEIFNAIEKMGYMRTGLTAWGISHKPEGAVMEGLSPEVEAELRKNLQWLASNVAGNQTQKLLEYGEKHSPVSKYLAKVRHQISDLYAGMPISVFYQYPEINEQCEQSGKFLEGSAAWKASKFEGGEEQTEVKSSPESEEELVKCSP
jgi:5'-deoxynucleotidase YfbR-like HD superfamily hydrolase